eukprot:CAMPEP_0171462748 /NCGR_PEP_ID=MMETSP0945-20130129/6655_1 /TAXON_ID=109269 /ORGANISM="Vaucheria litorea, Strain CCMP2940" /LENGTH=443 /DNA_ID=CAMNT_0011989323 /DNA_START=138 /DNA_END=1469 /DNA_ORIENTATION=-
MKIDSIMLCQVPNLGARIESKGKKNLEIVKNSIGESTFYNKLIKDEDCIIYEHVRENDKPPIARAYLRAGPRNELHFDPVEVNAAIVTCGAICPGLNSVIHHLIDSLKNIYKVNKIYGIQGGWGGFHDEEKPYIDLYSASNLQFLQHRAGSILGCATGGFDLEKIMTFIEENEINQLYAIGGDGTQRGAHKIAAECMFKGLNVSVTGIPKSIDNDIDLLDRSFGFLTAVEATQDAIRSATIEAKCNLPNGIGIVKLMGRSTGYLAAYATMASGDVDLCLVPEVDMVLSGPNGCLSHLEKVVEKKGFAVVVISEGAGKNILSNDSNIKNETQHFDSIGEYMKSKINKYFEEQGKQATCKYIDPSVTVRSVAANSFDQILCMQLAQNAVHGAMAGYTAFCTGVINNRTVFIPTSEIIETSPKRLNPRGRTWERVLCITRQPNTFF